jgi:hypothetical protein
VRGPLKVIAHNHTQVDLFGYNLNRLIVKVVRVSWRVAFPRYPEQERLRYIKFQLPRDRPVVHRVRISLRESQDQITLV